jgi:MFS family permease
MPTNDDAGISARAVLKNRSVVLMLAVTVLSSTAAMGQALALGKLVYDLTGSKANLGWIGLAEFLPTALLVLVAGSVADRFDRRKVGAIAFGVEVVVGLLMAVYAASSPSVIWPAFALAGAYGTARGFASPATRALPPMIVPPEALQRVVAMWSTSWQVATIIGPVLAGLLYAVGPAVPFVCFAMLYAGAALCLLAIRLRDSVRASTEKPSLRTALEGLKFVRRTPLILAIISLDLFAVLFGGAVALLPALADERLGIGSVGLGWLRAAGGIGAGATAIYLAARPFGRHVGKTLLYAVAVFGAATVVLGATRSYVVAFVMMAALMAADMVSVFIRSTMLPLATPDAMRGRVLAVEGVFIGASNELGAFESGMAAEWLGTSPAIIVGGLITIAIVVVWWIVFPAMRNIDRFSELEHAR